MKFSDYKAQIRLTDVLTDVGYQYDKKDGRTMPVYKLYAGSQKIDEVIIKNPLDTANQYYFDRNGNGGDLINFIHKHPQLFTRFYDAKDAVFLNNVLQHYAVNTNIGNLVNTNFSKKVEFDAARYMPIPATASDFKFLRDERKISLETIEKFLPFLRLTKFGNNINTSFPMRVPGTKEITNYELRNTNFKSFAAGGDKSNSVWYACFVEPKQVKEVYFFESSIDAMSYYDLHKGEKDFTNSAFVSLGGNLCASQIEKSLNLFSNAEVHACFDSDFNGRKYDIMLYCIANHLKEVKMERTGLKTAISVNGKNFVLGNDELSLPKFLENADLKANIIVEKSNFGKDFNDELKKKVVETNKKIVFEFKNSMCDAVTNAANPKEKRMIFHKTKDEEMGM